MATIFCVGIHYGPCNSFFTVSHKPEKLIGLRDRLQTIGFRVHLIPVKFENYCMLEMAGHEVFRCNIKNLKFNTPYYQDPVCQRAVQAVVEATTKLLRARTHLWFLTLLQNRFFGLSEYQLKDHWPQKYELESCAPISTCIDCCDICSTKNK
ncbi:UPF0728 protein C10orf53 homolog [Amyelois transitella]|uniref:UPF0728 protein C10orf53 homolog n=1 Tax=Amyelois transitella TaxID=680683 RepID=UPI00067DD9EC|nr:UPF0728 protein C10orf53 homolog [Amyelois transitella]